MLRLFLLLYSFALMAQTPPWQTRAWHTLLHYKDNLFGGTRSEADGPLFFFAKEGKNNPELEYQASLQAYLKPIPKNHNAHPICRFPARFEFIKKHEKKKFPRPNCKELNWWLKSIKAKSATLIYSSAFANNPASIFGHTLLRLNSSTEENISDYSINFAAITSGQGGVVYAIKGMFGGYQGMYSLTPYYQQINKYSHSESRDIWEYDLSLTKTEVRKLLLHLWELSQSTYFDYFFMDENCSYQLLTLVEAVKPEWQLSHGFVFYALPTDTLKRFAEVGAIKGKQFRPAFKKQMWARINNLNIEQKKQFQLFLDKKTKIESIKDVTTLDALISYFRYRNFKLRRKPSYYKTTLQNILFHRAKQRVKTRPFAKDRFAKYANEQPLFAHESYRFIYSAGHNEQNGFADFSFEMGLHKLDDPDLGYPPNQHINFLSATARYYFDPDKGRKLRLKDYTVFDVFSLFALRKNDFELSWKLKFAGSQRNNFRNPTLVHFFQGGGGLYSEFFSKRLGIYSLILASAWYTPYFTDNFRVGPMNQTGFIWQFSSRFKFNVYGEVFYDLLKNQVKDLGIEYYANLSYVLNKKLQLQVSGKLSPFYDDLTDHATEIKTDLVWFF